MHKGKNIAVVVPCYNEEKNIAAVLDTMPGFVDKIIAVDDNSRDNTAGILKVYSQINGQRGSFKLEKNLSQKYIYQKCRIPTL